MTNPARWMKDFEINKLQRESDHQRHEPQTPKSLERFREIRNMIKKFANEKKTSFYKKKFQSKNKNDIWKVIQCVITQDR